MFLKQFRLPHKRTVFSGVPTHYDEMAYTQRSDILEAAGIQPEDTPFCRLVKLCALRWYKAYFYPSLSDTYEEN